MPVPQVTEHLNRICLSVVVMDHHYTMAAVFAKPKISKRPFGRASSCRRLGLQRLWNARSRLLPSACSPMARKIRRTTPLSHAQAPFYR